MPRSKVVERGRALSDSKTSKTTAADFHAATPIPRVHSLEVSLDHQVRLPGFEMDWNAQGTAPVTRGGRGLMLCERDQGDPGTRVWISVGDAEARHREFSGKAQRSDSANQLPWALEFHVEDPDRHILRSGSDPGDDQRFSGWLQDKRKVPARGLPDPTILIA